MHLGVPVLEGGTIGDSCGATCLQAKGDKQPGPEPSKYWQKREGWVIFHVLFRYYARLDVALERVTVLHDFSIFQSIFDFSWFRNVSNPLRLQSIEYRISKQALDTALVKIQQLEAGRHRGTFTCCIRQQNKGLDMFGIDLLVACTFFLGGCRAIHTEM